jgi:hypothetical protein
MEALQTLKNEISTIEAIIKLNALPGTDVAAIALQELDFLSMHMIAKPFIAECIPETVIQAVKYSLKNNLSLDPNAGLVYLMPTSVSVGGVYKKALEIKPTADGKLSIAYQCGTILDNERAVVKKDGQGKVTEVSIRILLPSVPSPRWETIEMDQADFDRLKKYSHIKNSRGKQDADMKKLNYANPLYTNFNGGIDPEFARSKVISVALKKRGTNMAARTVNKIVVTEQKEVVVEQSEYAEVVESTTNPVQPANNNLTVNAEDL